MKRGTILVIVVLALIVGVASWMVWRGSDVETPAVDVDLSLPPSLPPVAPMPDPAPLPNPLKERP